MNVRALAAQARIETLLTLRRGESLIVTLGIPVGILVFASKVEAVSDSSPLSFLVPGVLALAVVSSAIVSLGIATGFERRFGVLKRLGSTPLGPSGLLGAKVLNVLAIEVLQIVVLLVTAALLGYRIDGRIGLAVVFLLVGSLAFAGIGMLLAGTLRADANLAVLNALYLIFVFIGGMAYPLDKLPDSVAAVARLFPAAALADLMRFALDDAAFSVGALVVLLAWAVVLPLLAVRFFRWEE